MSKADDYWEQFLATHPAGDSIRTETYVAEHFGDSPALADELAALIESGRKTATCSALWEWEAEGSPIPKIGLKSIVLDGRDEPVCIIETTEIVIRPYNEVDAQFAAEEGEGDLSLAYWREAHWRFFTRTLSNINKMPALDMPLVCERFRVIYR
jgi:uncharacterized protein YhfF